MSNGFSAIVMVAGMAPGLADLAETTLCASGWRVTRLADVAEIIDAREIPALLIVDCATAAGPDHDIVRAIRDHGGPAASVPILAVVATPTVPPSCDDAVEYPVTADVLARAAARWRPDGAAAALDRLEAAFGSAPIRAMIVQFRALLCDALAALDHGDAAAIAHRVAGVAGTMGFAAAGKAWLALSEGDAAAGPIARREARRAIATIDRRQNAIEPSTSV